MVFNKRGMIAIVIILPIVIHVLFKIEAPSDFLVSVFSPGDIITYFYLAISVIIGLDIFSEEQRRSVLPSFIFNPLNVKNSHNFAYKILNPDTPIVSKNEVEAEYKEFFVNEIYVILDKEIKYQTELSQSQKDALLGNGFVLKKMGSLRNLVFCKLITAPFRLENMGNGPAINCRFGVNKNNQVKKYLEPKSFKKEEGFYVHLFSMDSTDDIVGEYKVDLFYSDIHGNRYEQSFGFTIEKNKDNDEFTLSIDPIGKNKLLRREGMENAEITKPN